MSDTTLEITDGASGDPTKAELQRRMDATRADISETVAEIKEVVSQQYDEIRDHYETVKEGVSEALDWSENFEKSPVVWGAGAVAVGVLIGVGLSQALEKNSPGDRKGEAPLTEKLLGELSGLAEAVLPTLTGKVKEMFGVDLTAYLPSPDGAAERAPGSLTEGRPRAGKGGAANKRAAKKRATKKGAAKKRGGAKKGSARIEKAE